MTGDEYTYHVDPGCCKCGIRDHAFTTLGCRNEQFGWLVLLSDKRRDISLETSSTETHNDDRNNEAGKRTM